MSGPPARASQWQSRAKELRAHVHRFNDPANRAMILRRAAICDDAAKRASERETLAPENYDESGYYNSDPMGFFAARREHAWLLRVRGSTYRIIGVRLGVTPGRSREMIARHARSLRPSLYERESMMSVESR